MSDSVSGVAMSQVVQDCKVWFEHVVLGLNLCPFAHQPAKEGLVRFVELLEASDAALFHCLEQEINALQALPSHELETTLILAPQGYDDFYLFNDYLSLIDRWLIKKQWDGFVQVASFHPNYIFAGAEPEDEGNLTNRSPYPIFHLIREQSLTEVIDRGADTGSIPERNIKTIHALSREEKRKLFPYVSDFTL